MSCQRMIRMLSARQDGELSPQREQQVESHLRDCAACRAEWRELQRLARSLRLAPAPAADPFFPMRVMAGLPAAKTGRTRLVQAAACVLACASVFAGGLFLQFSSGSHPPAAPVDSPGFSAVLLESRDLGLLSVQEDTLSLFEENANE